jgi:KTSC domain
MALPLLASGIGTIISTEAAIGGSVLGAEFSALAARIAGPEVGNLIARLIHENDHEVTIPVTSSAISSIGYRVGGIIVVEFNRGGARTYEYMGSEEVFMAFLASASKGAFFNAHFR